jgi:hypothetical protein
MLFSVVNNCVSRENHQFIRPGLHFDFCLMVLLCLLEFDYEPSTARKYVHQASCSVMKAFK